MLRKLFNGSEKGGQLWTNMLLCYGLKDGQVLREFIQKIQYLDPWLWAPELRILIADWSLVTNLQRKARLLLEMIGFNFMLVLGLLYCWAVF